MPSLGWQELLLILVIVIIIFGVGKLPEIGGAMGKGIREVRGFPVLHGNVGYACFIHPDSAESLHA